MRNFATSRELMKKDKESSKWNGDLYFCTDRGFSDSRVANSRSIMWNCLAQLLIILSLLKWSHQDTVEQPVPEMTVEEESNVTLNCTLKTSYANPEVFWYSQLPRQPPQYVFYLYGGMVKRNPDYTDRFSSKFDKATKVTELTISRALISDIAVYFCAMDPTLVQRYSGFRTKTHTESSTLCSAEGALMPMNRNNISAATVSLEGRFLQLQRNTDLIRNRRGPLAQLHQFVIAARI
ncbi:uncharacterized protein [Heterodontus francisci]|uniref:uncharacterized protein n=1 Tax=Heterodontus francisci TaxID=7792 RepID=UPI00355B43ED